MSTTAAPSIDRLAAAARDVPGIRARFIEAGDQMVVRTKNSVYSLVSLGDGRFQVTGGWFAASGVNGSAVRVVGCTWGRSALLTGMVAAPGMCIEFDNGVCTTRVREVRLLRPSTKTVH